MGFSSATELESSCLLPKPHLRPLRLLSLFLSAAPPSTTSSVDLDLPQPPRALLTDVSEALESVLACAANDLGGTSAASAAAAASCSAYCSWCFFASAAAGEMPSACVEPSISAVTCETLAVAARPFFLSFLLTLSPSSSLLLLNALVRLMRLFLRASLLNCPSLRIIIDADETVDEIEMLSVDELSFELRIPNRRPVGGGLLDATDPEAMEGSESCMFGGVLGDELSIELELSRCPLALPESLAPFPSSSAAVNANDPFADGLDVSVLELPPNAFLNLWAIPFFPLGVSTCCCAVIAEAVSSESSSSSTIVVRPLAVPGVPGLSLVGVPALDPSCWLSGLGFFPATTAEAVVAWTGVDARGASSLRDEVVDPGRNDPVAERVEFSLSVLERANGGGGGGVEDDFEAARAPAELTLDELFLAPFCCAAPA